MHIQIHNGFNSIFRSQEGYKPFVTSGSHDASAYQFLGLTLGGYLVYAQRASCYFSTQGHALRGRCRCASVSKLLSVTSTRALERSPSTCNSRLRPATHRCVHASFGPPTCHRRRPAILAFARATPRNVPAGFPRTLGRSPSPSSTCNFYARPHYLRQVSSAHLSRSSTYRTHVSRGRLVGALRRLKTPSVHRTRRSQEPLSTGRARDYQAQSARARPYHANPKPKHLQQHLSAVGRFDVPRLDDRHDRLSIRSSRGRVRRRRARSDGRPDSSHQLEDTRLACSASLTTSTRWRSRVKCRLRGA
ncbi:hypothetical protein EXIGLDRAFT_489818 [Exidia glandulosa HHB12029]|uniref:Uncharacterized protein n=1 Tax=Exidia glandulosa HHB12029 TaxID=1314781 RepID=A0A165Z3D3_EXIGL|nr:hypothetical protein EXIGLDRAFT_489818 [Exidia glandulosa HHB12029]